MFSVEFDLGFQWLSVYLHTVYSASNNAQGGTHRHIAKCVRPQEQEWKKIKAHFSVKIRKTLPMCNDCKVVHLSLKFKHWWLSNIYYNLSLMSIFFMEMSVSMLWIYINALCYMPYAIFAVWPISHEATCYTSPSHTQTYAHMWIHTIHILSNSPSPYFSLFFVSLLFSSSLFSLSFPTLPPLHHILSCFTSSLLFHSSPSPSAPLLYMKIQSPKALNIFHPLSLSNLFSMKRSAKTERT